MQMCEGILAKTLFWEHWARFLLHPLVGIKHTALYVCFGGCFKAGTRKKMVLARILGCR